MIRFRDFMEQTVVRYYSSPTPKFASGGDFFTAPELDPLFGEAIADFLLPYIGEMENPVLLELGAGRGVMARDILSFYRKHHPTLFERLSYWIYEASPYLREVQRRTLAEFGNVRWIEELEPLEGVILSNEFFDALPVHVVANGKELYLNDRGEEIWLPLEDGEITRFMERMGYRDSGCRIEVPLDALRMLRGIGASLRKGYHLVIDYGYTSEEIRAFPQGTLVAYKKHRFSSDIYSCAGEADVSAMVNFSALVEFGRDFGLETLFLKKQRDFLLDVPRFVEQLEALSGRRDPDSIERMSRIKIMLVSMGERFRVLFQCKEL